MIIVISSETVYIIGGEFKNVLVSLIMILSWIEKE